MWLSMGLFDLVKTVLGDPVEPASPSMAEITIISSDPVTPTSESQSATARD
jgi:hypothetical protein